MAESFPTKALSVVIAASNGEALLKRCLESLAAQSGADEVEVIAVTNYALSPQLSDGPLSSLATFVEMPAGTTVPLLRSAGIERASGSIVALSEDNCTFEARWAEAIRRAHAEGHSVVGGAVENSSGSRPLNWAVFFYEYGRYMPPLEEGAASALPGNNLSYAKEILQAVKPLLKEGFYETFLHEVLKEEGQELFMAPAALVYHIKGYRWKEVIPQSYFHGRLYAGKRIAHSSHWKRGLMALGSLLLPALLPLRIAGMVFKKGRHRDKLVLAFPTLVFLMTLWAAGEFLGYIAGPGRSIDKWV